MAGMVAEHGGVQSRQRRGVAGVWRGQAQRSWRGAEAGVAQLAWAHGRVPGHGEDLGWRLSTDQTRGSHKVDSLQKLSHKGAK